MGGAGMKLLLLLCGPAVMILIGLQGVGSVPVTFVLFYSWLLLVPLVDMLLRKEKKLSQAMRDCGLVFRRKNMYSGMSTGIFFFWLFFWEVISFTRMFSIGRSCKAC